MKELGRRSSLKSARVGRSPPEPGHAGEWRSGHCGRGNRRVKQPHVVVPRCTESSTDRGLNAWTDEEFRIKATPN